MVSLDLVNSRRAEYIKNCTNEKPEPETVCLVIVRYPEECHAFTKLLFRRRDPVHVPDRSGYLQRSFNSREPPNPKYSSFLNFMCWTRVSKPHSLCSLASPHTSPRVDCCLFPLHKIDLHWCESAFKIRILENKASRNPRNVKIEKRVPEIDWTV